MSGDDFAADIYVSGLDHIDLIGGGNASFICYINRVQKCGTILRVPRVNIIMPLLEVPDAIRQSMLIPVHEQGVVRRLNPMWLH
ncbi:hypothetical protein EJ076_34910 [Mesorhizobium sp. M7D.F.Ca.US.005.01.1.1]|uniref:hypothetical protein n=1 Tax=Mesorhizobium sp. M7D.F.Ca.US.005.01.1.1 TaxID=2493678 RepID=UPI000F763874|nr:hypothetical protein [Mesorhizobium sp. M7D.F.Ca.US.005.01.1.1]AZO45908.1 hypothetical protein EJ076_34910 [Mesorhizobium sp. M7D.F.Ca.US.005.01.1.1]